MATVDNETYLLEVAHQCTAAQVEQLVRSYRGVINQYEQCQRVKKQFGRRYVRYYTEEDGSMVITARLPAEEGAWVITALEAGADDVWQSAPRDKPDTGRPEGVSPLDDVRTAAELSTGDDTAESSLRLADEDKGFDVIEVSPEFVVDGDNWGTRRADALVRMAESWFAHGPKALAGGDKHQIVIHVDTDALAGGQRGDCSLHNGPWLCAETARRLGCDGAIVPLAEDKDGHVLNIGRKTRIIPPAILRALKSRDGGCRFPGCHNTTFVDAHHIQHWSKGGETKLDNLVLLCRCHHRLVHEGGFGVESRPDKDIEFRRPGGEVMPTTAEPTPPKHLSAHTLAANNKDGGVDVPAAANLPCWDGVSVDYHTIVEGLMGRDGYEV